MPHRRLRAVIATAVAATAAATLLSGALDSGSVSAPPSAGGATDSAQRARGPVRVVAVGDIACPPGRSTTPQQCQHGATARLTQRIDPDVVLTLGDLQYETGALHAFRRSYDATWGDLRDRTLPVPGNHEYGTPEADGYFTYFEGRQPGPPGWYARDLGRWRAYLLNSNCTRVDCGAQLDWLARDLRQRPTRCTLMALHHPRFSSGHHGSDRSMRRFFRVAYRHGVELFLSGHDHHYERFRRLAPDGTRARDGVVQFVSGVGGKTFYGTDGVARGSAYRRTHEWGVLRLSLRRGEYRHSFAAIGGAVRDRGRGTCH